MASYEITATNGQRIAIVADGSLDTSSTSLGLIGRRYADYGLVFNNNQIKLMENFADTTPPSSPRNGQIWFDSSPGINLLKVFRNSTQGWVPLAFTENFTDSLVRQNVEFQGSNTFTNTVSFKSTVSFTKDVSMNGMTLDLQDVLITGNPTFNVPAVFNEAVTFKSETVFQGNFIYNNEAFFTENVSFSKDVDVTEALSAKSLAISETIFAYGQVNISASSNVSFSKSSAVPSTTAGTAKAINLPDLRNDEDTILFCSFSGTEGSTTIEDGSKGTLVNGGAGPNNVFTVSGNSFLSTFNNRGGISSLFLDGTGDYVTITDNTNFDFTTDEFTIDMWIYPSTVSGTQSLLTKGTSATDRWEVILNGAALSFLFNDGTTTLNLSGGVISVETWTHVAVSRNINGANSDFYIFVNGARVDSDSIVSTTCDMDDVTGDIEIGRRSYGTFEYFSGYISDLRAVKGTSKYKNGFKPNDNPLAFSDVLGYVTSNGVHNLSSNLGGW